MSTARVNITSPVGRIVMGNLYEPNTKDFDGKPLVIKTGPNAGQPTVRYFFGLAIPKGTERHWAETEWGKQIWAVGHTAFPAAAQRPDFSWKIEDGDSVIPNKRNRKPCDNEGWKGHWILKLSGGFAPKIYRQDGDKFVQATDVDYVKCGYFVEVAFSVDGNGQQNNPGVYLNHAMVCFRAYGPEIVFGPNVDDAGFGKSALPAGASATPPPSAIPLPAAPSQAPLAPLPPYAGPAPLPPSSAAPLPVMPNPAFLQVPPPATGNGVVSPIAIVAPPLPVPVVPSSPALKMTAAAGAVTYEAYRTGGWSDAQLIANGLATV